MRVGIQYTHTYTVQSLHPHARLPSTCTTCHAHSERHERQSNQPLVLTAGKLDAEEMLSLISPKYAKRRAEVRSLAAHPHRDT